MSKAGFELMGKGLTCQLCVLEYNAGKRNRDAIFEFQEPGKDMYDTWETFRSELLEHYYREHSLDVTGECEGCEQEFINLEFNTYAELNDFDEFEVQRRVYCRECSSDDALLALFVKKDGGS